MAKKKKPVQRPVTYQLHCGDWLALLSRLDAGSVDMVMVDPPYGTTACKWDTPIDLGAMWPQLLRVCRRNAAMVFTASQPFTSALVMSNPKLFKYAWTWNKINRVSGHLNAKKQPLRVVEDVCVFYAAQPVYHPQMVAGTPYTARSKGRKSDNYGAQADGVVTVCDGQRYPRNYLEVAADERGTVGRVHPTQKPVALMAYLIRTYSNPGDVVLDFTMGSGTTGVACMEIGRSFIGGDNDPDYVEMATRRIEAAAAGR